MTHSGPESRGVLRKEWAEALTGVRAGQVLSRKEANFGMPTSSEEAQNRSRWYREKRRGPARSETLGMYGNTLLENRKSLCPPLADGVAGRVGKSKDARRR